jgi:acyl-CoA thioester hydrolase
VPAVIVDVPLRWADLDPYGHVNNVAVVGVLEQARILALWDGAEPVLPALDPASAVQVVVADLRVAYLTPIGMDVAAASVAVSVESVGGASFVLGYEVSAAGVLCAQASTALALVDAATGAPVRLAPAVRARLRELMATP